MKQCIAYAALAALAGCASFSPDGGFAEVDAAVKQRTGQDSVWVRTEDDAKLVTARVRELLAAPLGPEQAVAIALLNNRALQAAFAEIGVSEAERVQAGRLVNPGFSVARLTRGDEREIERKLVFDLLDLFTLPQRIEIAAQRFEQVKLGAAAQAVRVAATTRRAWFEAVAAGESAKYFEQAKVAAETSTELAARMARAGNSPQLARLREQAFLAEAGAQLGRARQNALAARERLARAMGLAGPGAAFTLPDRLPGLPGAPREAHELEAKALAERLDVRAARHESESLAASLGLARATRFVDSLELGAIHNSASGAEPQKGLELELRLPVFDTGDARLARAQHLHRQALNRAAHAEANARSEVREAYGAYRTAWELARRYHDEIVPLRKKISEEQLLRYNGMLIGVFELIADARDSIAAINGYLEALRDFWLAESALQTALTGGPPAAVEIRATALPAAAAGGH